MFRSWFASSRLAAAVADIRRAAGTPYSGYVSNNDLSGVGVDGEIVVAIATYARAGYIIPAINAISNYPAKQSRADDNRKYAKVDQRNRSNEVVCICGATEFGDW